MNEPNPTKTAGDIASRLVARLENRTALIGVIGLGYVGLPVATTFARAGFGVVGVDASAERVRPIQEGRSYLLDVPDEEIAAFVRAKRLRATTSYRSLARADAVLICVPTPLSEGIPDMTSIESAGRGLGKVLSPDTLVVLESTTYPGTTEEVLKPLLETSGLVAGRDFLLAYSPERIDPGNPHYSFSDIPKVVGGMGDAATRAAATLYGQVVPKITTVSGTREAEMAKLIENTYRHVNIGLVNELAVYAHEWGVDIWEAIEAAATKPFGYMPFWPSPGWGGHCIPLDPSYLSWKVRREHAHELRFVELAQTINAEMPRYVAERISLLLNEHGKALRNSRILGIGMAYKGGTEDTRGSAGMKVMRTLDKRGAEVAYHDPLVPQCEINGRVHDSESLTEDTLRAQDLVVVLIQQPGVDLEVVLEQAPLVMDCCNAFGRKDPRVIRL